MDTSKKYIKMCEKATKIQSGSQFGHVKFNYFAGQSLRIYYGGIDTIETHYIWLPRQDQLQEMLPNYDLDSLEVKFHLWLNDINYSSNSELKSFEQLWLAFVMKEKFNKYWDNEKSDWVGWSK